MHTIQKIVLLLLIILGIMTTISISKYIYSETDKSEIQFIISEGNSLVQSGPMTNTGGIHGKTRTFYGRIDDTGQINIFHTYSFNDDIAVQRTYYLKQRILKSPHSSEWFKITGKCYLPENALPTGLHIDVEQWRQLSELGSRLDKAIKTSY
jgi:hypothetical protein